jgi:hypothetical protein
MIPQGNCTFAGSQALLSASFTLSHGIEPSVAALGIAPRPGRLPEQGPLVLSYGGTRMVFPDCRLASLAGEIDSAGREVWKLAIADRRWRWQFVGRISGRYNVRKSDGGKGFVGQTERSPRDLARLCLEALGERRYDVSQLPDESRPEIDWDYELPAAALARLCDSLGARVVLRLDNSIALAPIGAGRRLALSSDALAAETVAEPPLRPEKLVLVCGRTRWQRDFSLEAVGLEADGSLVPIDELSYAPSDFGRHDPWRYCDLPHMHCVSRPEARSLARQSVFRYYRVTVPFSLPAASGKLLNVSRLDQVLPLSTEQLQWAAGVAGQIVTKPALVYGVFHGGFEATRSQLELPKANLEARPRGLYSGRFSIDRERGLVIFAEPVFRYVDAGTGGAERNLVAPAELYLRTSVSLRDGETGGWLRHEVTRRAKGKRTGAPPRYVRADDLALSIIENHAPPRPGRAIDNRQLVEAEANRRLDALDRELRAVEPAHVSYAGLKPIDLDGAISQVTWNISPEGFATTRVKSV